MNWAPEDRLNTYAAELIAEQADPPRRVGMADLIKTQLPLLGLLALPVFLVPFGLLVHEALLLLLGFSVIVLVASLMAWQAGGARSALQFGVAASARVVDSTGPRGRAGTLVTLTVDGPTGAVETRLVRSDAANVLAEGDVVQVMVDPQTYQVVLVLGLLKPSPLYAPPKN